MIKVIKTYPYNDILNFEPCFNCYQYTPYLYSTEEVYCCLTCAKVISKKDIKKYLKLRGKNVTS